MTKLQQIINRIDYKKILLVVAIGFICYGASSFNIVSLQIQSERLNKQIYIQELTPTMPPLEVIR